MMVARIGDIVPGICYCVPTPPGPYPDTGIIQTGDPMYIDSGMPVARVGDIVMFSCGTSTIVTGSPMKLSGGPPVSRASDMVTGCGVGSIGVGSPTNMST